MSVNTPNVWQGGRDWRNISLKWGADPEWSAAGDSDEAEALAEARIDDAQRAYELAVAREPDARSHTGLGDVFLARGEWAMAAEQFVIACRLDPTALVPRLGLAHANIMLGTAHTSVSDLDAIEVAKPGDPVVRYYLALALWARTVEVRSQTRTGELVLVEPEQLTACEGLTRRLLALGVPDEELTTLAGTLLTAVQRGRRWVWIRDGAAALHAVVAVLVGGVGLALAGLAGSLLLVVLAAVVGAILVFTFVLRFRRLAWQVHADEAAALVWRRGH
ncbi:hypothetical protein F0L68_00535 [Solihabitans fulvus]|uniref:Tetratricopeptide repeat protein n=1 Tax=Solihabitans fulvus TaxID=1892852 RepID=A0A5B2XV74_9PSEU|nr:hypothetical protein [Solihabitans fulvus]KAA2267055.1 hypothetical protein F0L68_00535 [Solihabitans fulvus]